MCTSARARTVGCVLSHPQARLKSVFTWVPSLPDFSPACPGSRVLEAESSALRRPAIKAWPPPGPAPEASHAGAFPDAWQAVPVAVVHPKLTESETLG